MGNKGIKLIKPIKIDPEEYAGLEWKLGDFKEKEALTPDAHLIYTNSKGEPSIRFTDYNYEAQKDFEEESTIEEMPLEGMNMEITLEEENAKLRERLSKLESKGKNIQTQTDTQGSPSQTKMDEMGAHSPLNAKKSTVSDNDTASPVQTVAGKDSSNPLMAVTLPISERDEGSSSRRKLPLS